MNASRRVVLLATATGLALAGCGDDGPSRGDVLGDLATEVAIPRLEAFAASADTVADAVAAACDDPTADRVDGALTAVEDARLAWLATQAVWTGPAMERRSDALVEWPVRASDIDAFVERSGPGEVTADVVAKNVGADTRGLSAVHFVLSTDDVDDRLADPAWCDYLGSASTVVAEQGALLVGDWTESFLDGAPFAEQVADDDAAQGWLSMVVNDNINLVHKLTEEPRDLGDEPMDVGPDRAAQLAGVGAVFGALGPLLGDDLSERVTAEIDTARDAYAAGDVDEGRTLTEAVEATIATEVAARLDVTIGFSDADGDSAG